jgi:hypothetical protein
MEGLAVHERFQFPKDEGEHVFFVQCRWIAERPLRIDDTPTAAASRVADHDRLVAGCVQRQLDEVVRAALGRDPVNACPCARSTFTICRHIGAAVRSRNASYSTAASSARVRWSAARRFARSIVSTTFFLTSAISIDGTCYTTP